MGRFRIEAKLGQGGMGVVYLAEELTEELVDRLSMTRGLNVRPRGIVARRSPDGADPRAVGQALDVEVVVEGWHIRREDMI